MRHASHLRERKRAKKTIFCEASSKNRNCKEFRSWVGWLSPVEDILQEKKREEKKKNHT
jgi:hypothetical protein